MTAGCQWHRIAGVWYEVTLGLFEPGDGKTALYDMVLRRLVTGSHHKLLLATYGQPGCYGLCKRQLGHKALRAHGLVSQPG